MERNVKQESLRMRSDQCSNDCNKFSTTTETVYSSKNVAYKACYKLVTEESSIIITRLMYSFLMFRNFHPFQNCSRKMPQPKLPDLHQLLCYIFSTNNTLWKTCHNLLQNVLKFKTLFSLLKQLVPNVGRCSFIGFGLWKGNFSSTGISFSKQVLILTVLQSTVEKTLAVRLHWKK